MKHLYQNGLKLSTSLVLDLFVVFSSSHATGYGHLSRAVRLSNYILNNYLSRISSIVFLNCCTTSETDKLVIRSF